MTKEEAEKNYYDALRAWKLAVGIAHDQANDAYKPPEVNVLQTYQVMNAAHQLQIAYQVLMVVSE